MPRIRARLLEAMCGALGALAADTADRLGGSLGVLAYHLGVRRRVVRDNLRTALGLRGWRRAAVARRSYATMGANFLALWSVGRPHGPERGLACLDPGWHARLQGRHPAMVYLTLHLGSWDMGAHGIRGGSGRVLAYAKAQHDAEVDALVNRQRDRAGIDVVLARHGDRTGAVAVLRRLRDGGPVGLMADQKPSGGEGFPAWFLGQPTPCHRGPAFFARRARAPLVPGICLRVAAGRYRLFIGRPLAWDALDEDALAQRAMDLLSAMVAAFPGQYFWHHRRFKKRSEGLTPRASEPWRVRGLRLLVDPA